MKIVEFLFCFGFGFQIVSFYILNAVLRGGPLAHNERGATQQLFFSDENTKELLEQITSRI